MNLSFRSSIQNRGTYPPAPLFASLIVGYACAYKERGAWFL